MRWDKFYKNLDENGLLLDFSSTEEIPEKKLYNMSKPVNPEMAKMKMNSDLLNLFNKNLQNTDDFEKENK